ncbi:hypothetical protein ACO0R3_000879 [Hanseniaspora guilliermondii]
MSNTSNNSNSDITSLDSQHYDESSSSKDFRNSDDSLSTSLGGAGFLNDFKLATKVSSTNIDYVVPYKERQGILSRFCIIQQFKNPHLYPDSIKVFIVFICAVAAVIGPFQASILFPALRDIEKEYKTTATKTNISVGVYLLALGIFPIYHSSFSEMHGKRNVYVVSFMMLFVFCLLLCLVSHNISTFIILRFFCGVFSSSVQSLGAGTLADIYEPERRGSMFGFFYLGSLLAPLLAPIIGALLCNSFNWKSTQWFVLIFSIVVLLLLVFCLPETSTDFRTKKTIIADMIKNQQEQNKSSNEYEDAFDNEKQLEPDQNELASRILSREPSVMHYKKIVKPNNVGNTDEGKNDFREDNFDVLAPTLNKVTTNTTTKMQEIENEIADQQLEKIKTIISENLQTFKKTGHYKEKIDYKLFFKLYFVKPLKMLLYLKHPPVILAIAFSSVSFGVLYYVNMTLEKTYSQPPYNFKPLYVGLCYIPNSVTYIIASIFGGRYVDKRLVKYKKEHNGVLFPESRLSYNVLLAVLLFPPALLIIGWCFDKKTFWVFPLIGTAIFGFSSMLIIGATNSYLTDEVKGSRGVALNNFVRQTFAAVACFTSDKAVNSMTVGWFFTFLAFVVLLASGSLILLKKKSAYFRNNYDIEKIKLQVETL